jgi:hypothetical protein
MASWFRHHLLTHPFKPPLLAAMILGLETPQRTLTVRRRLHHQRNPILTILRVRGGLRHCRGGFLAQMILGRLLKAFKMEATLFS